MSKKIVVVLVLIVILGGAVMYMKGGKMPQNSQSVSSGKKSMSDLAGSNVSQKCTFKEDRADPSTGTVWVMNGKARGDLSIAGGGARQNFSIIVNGNDLYEWEGGLPEGYKITTEEAKTDKHDIIQEYNRTYDYACQPWSVDAGMFVLPAGVTF